MTALGRFLKTVAEYVTPWVVLAGLLSFSYAKFFQHPYGFTWDPAGRIEHVFIEQADPTLRLGDQLRQVGPLTWDEFRADLTKAFFTGVSVGEIVPVQVERNGQLLTIPWMLPGTNRGEVIDQFFSEWLMAYLFWLAGVLTLLFLRPKDDRWRLLSAFNFLTAIWISAGSGLSNFHIGNSALILRVAIWLSVPVYLHLHWVFPRPLGKLPPLLVAIGYAAAFGLMILQWFQLISRNLYLLGFLIAIFGSLILLIVHAVRQPDTRRDLRLLLAAAFFILVPVFAVALNNAISAQIRAGNLALLGFPLLPAVYLYVAYRRRLGGAELRANRLLSLYTYSVILGAILLVLVLPVTTASLPSESINFFTIAGALLVAVVSILVFPAYQSFVEQRFLGVKLPYQNLQEIYSTRITTSTSLTDLLALLKEEVFPTLLIRQYMFLQLDEASPKVLLASGVTEERPAAKDELTSLEALAGKQRFASERDENQPYSWVRLTLPLSIDEDLIGLWLLGRRDPDDLYPQAEIPILQSLANQTAIALSNVLQADRLRTLYQQNIDRHEQERMRLARDLHDGILNEMAVLSFNLDPSSVLPKFKGAYDGLVQRLREIVSDLRPPMLQYGLKPALEELGDSLMERGKDKVIVEVDVQGGENRYPWNVELHLFRIAQEAVKNAIRHGRPGKIKISGRLGPDKIQLTVEDDGEGFEAGKLDLNSLYLNKHFGLIGMAERANLIGAEFSIDSAPGAGTRIRVTWNGK